MQVVWNFNRVKGSGTNALSYGGLPTSMDYTLAKKDEEVVDAAFLHAKCVGRGVCVRVCVCVWACMRYGLLFALGREDHPRAQ